DASGAVPLDGGGLAVADDEDNLIRIYDAEGGGDPLAAVDVSSAAGSKKEMDLEAATRIGDRALWLSSHGRNKKGKRKPTRLVLFATTAAAPNGKLQVLGEAYDDLLADLG